GCRPGRTGSSSALTPPANTARSSSSARAPRRASTGNESSGHGQRQPRVGRTPLNHFQPDFQASGASAMSMNYQDRIPNNVDLGSNRTLQRALEHWQPEFLNWWQELGPKDFQVADVYLRTATSVDAKGWATYGFVRMPEYRWGIFLAERNAERKIGFGDNLGQEM